jgi:hypothetical protein
MSEDRKYQVGVKYIGDTTPVTADFNEVICLEATVIGALTAKDAYQWDANIEGVSLPAGVYAFRGSAITLTSGSVILNLINPV